MRRPQSVRRVITRGWMIVASLATTGAIVSLGGSAAAFPQPTIAEVEHEISVLNNKASVLGQQYDQVLQDLSLANARLKPLNRETKRYRANFEEMRAQVDRIAAVAYEQGAIDSPIGLLTSNNANEVLDQSSVLQRAVERRQRSDHPVPRRQPPVAERAAAGPADQAGHPRAQAFGRPRA